MGREFVFEYHLRYGRTTTSALFAAALALSTYFYIRPALRYKAKEIPKTSDSPRKTVLPHISPEETDRLPYPPNVLPGGRDVDTPYGSIHVFEWGPEGGEKVLLLHGISTPSLALQNLADRLVNRGYRVMLFDLFGRGYSDGPTDLPFDKRLYMTQILLVLASSDLSWTGQSAFHLAGFSLGGAIAASFARYYPRMLRSLTLICPGGLIRPSHLTWQGKLLYSEGYFPELLLTSAIRSRLHPQPAIGNKAEAQNTRLEDGEPESAGGFDDVIISPTRPQVSVADVLSWQLRHNMGFVHSYISTIRNAPIYDQGDKDWAHLRGILEVRRGDRRKEHPGLDGGKICLILGDQDPVVVFDETVHDAKKVLGDDAVNVVRINGGHEVAISKGAEVAVAMMTSWRSS